MSVETFRDGTFDAERLRLRALRFAGVELSGAPQLELPRPELVPEIDVDNELEARLKRFVLREAAHA